MPIWELLFTKMPEESRKIATERLKWSLKYQKKHGIVSEEAKDLPKELETSIRDVCKRVYRTLMLSGYARIDLRLSDSGAISVIEANPNPQLSRDEDFAESARQGGGRLPGADPAHRESRHALGTGALGLGALPGDAARGAGNAGSSREAARRLPQVPALVRGDRRRTPCRG